MAGEPKNILQMGLGLIDYLRDKMEELGEELSKRGEERTEDIRDFIDDLRENIPVLRSGAAEVDVYEEREDKERTRAAELFEELDVKSRINEFLAGLGLATHEEISEMKDRIERLGRAVKHLED
jgi:polyhydroxyalkanoate synthesis regulator phasin